MKLRLQSNSIRLRLKRGEVHQLIKTGRIEEQVVFGPGQGIALKYVLETSPLIPGPVALLQKQTVIVQVPLKMAIRWAGSNEVGMEATQNTGSPSELRLLIEKDFACLNGPAAENVDTFPNPLAGTKC